ncbi:MAG: cyclic nucleotide-binding domain-containing protein, partial [Bdellovibrionales bacterium]|nr:cyclic nucleotide-binding domain-containing protein [Bdellovibrionales bacterium]
LYLVADGMGGHVGGARASSLVQQAFCQFLHSHLPAQGEDCSQIPWTRVFTNAVQSASQNVFRAAEIEPELKGMGSTLTGLYCRDGFAVLAHVGDSRLYLLRAGEIHQLSIDHTYVAELIALGSITPDQAKGHPYSHVLSRAVGVYEHVAADVLLFELTIGDRLLLCSDGFYDIVPDEKEILQLLSSGTLEEVCSLVEKLPFERTARDNVSCVFLEVLPNGEPQADQLARSREISLKVEMLQQVDLFESLDIRDIIHLVQSGQVLRCSAGDEIVCEGKVGSSLFVILEGEVSVTIGKEAVSQLHAGNHFGEMSLLLDAPRSATVTAISPALVLEIDSAAFNEFCSYFPRSGMEVFRSMAKAFSGRLREANARLSA